MRNALSFDSADAELTIHPDWRLEIAPQRPMTGRHRRFAFAVERLAVVPDTIESPGAPSVRYPITRIDFSAFRPAGREEALARAGAHATGAARAAARGAGDAIVLGGLTDQILLAALSSRARLVCQAWEKPEARAVVALTDPEAKLLVAGGGPGGKGLAAVQLDRLGVHSEIGHEGEGCSVFLQVASRVQTLAASGFAVSFTGRGVAGVNLSFDDFFIANSVAVPVSLTGVSATAPPPLQAEVQFDRNADGGPADPGLLPRPADTSGMPAVLALGRPPGRPMAKAGEATIRLGAGAFVCADMSGGRLRLRRAVDGFDLSFGFAGYGVVASRSGTRLLPLAGATKRLQIVHFWPQHLQEEVFSVAETQSFVARIAELFTAPPPPLPPWAGPQRRLAPDLPAAPFAQGITSRLARTQISGPSRIVFDRSDNPAAAIEVSAAALTSWVGLPLRTDRRALGARFAPTAVTPATGPPPPPKLMTLDRQIEEVALIGPGDSRDQAKARIKESFGWTKASGRAGLDPEVTALEVVTGTQASPDPGSTFGVPDVVAPVSPAEEWAATLVLGPDGAVRMLMAADLDLSMFDRGSDPVDISTASFATSLTRRDRRQTTMLTSAFGIAAKRALVLDVQGKPVARDREDSLVGVPGKPFAYLNPPISNIRQEGVMSPRPFASFRAKLGAFGADIDIEWKGEPPAADAIRPFFKPAFTHEHSTHRTRSRRDAFVEVVEKGYLFPFGFRAALVRVVRHQAVLDAELGWIYPLVGREFIATTRPIRQFNGPYHPYDARDLHARELRMLTQVTPFLDPGCMNDAWVPKAAGNVFWVRVNGLDFSFEYQADDLQGRRRAPMLFMDNAAVNDEAAVEAVLKKYEAIAPNLDAPPGSEPARRTERFSTAQARYAPSRSSGDTQFETDAAVLGARPRLRAASAEDPTSVFAMDAFMEGADQPPFYPYLERARVRVAALEQLTGNPTTRVEVRHFEAYREAGFDHTANASELFLRVLTPDIDMSIGDNAAATGGVARPNAALAALSRTTGLVGGRWERKGGAGPSLLDDATDANGIYDLSAAAAGRFDPSDFFRGATLLGIVPLEQVVKAAGIAAAPVIKQVFDLPELDAATAGATAARLRAIDSALADAVKAANDALARVDRSYTVAALYPDLGGSLAGFRAATIALAQGLEAKGGTAALLKGGPPLIAAWPALKAAIERLIRDPMPAVITAAINDLRERVQVIAGLFAPGGACKRSDTGLRAHD